MKRGKNAVFILFSFLLLTSCKISGTITSSGAPVSGVTVTVTRGNENQTATTNAGGYYEFKVDNGDFLVTPSLSGYSFNPQNRQVSVNNADRKGVDFQMVDSLPPVPGNSGRITLLKVTAETLTIGWDKAQDGATRQQDLQYAVFLSEDATLQTVAEITANGTQVAGWTADLTTSVVSGLSADTRYYLNLLVRDLSGNAAAYQMLAAATHLPVETFSEATSYFGADVAVSADGQTIAVGASGDFGTSGQGTAYVYRWSGTAWTTDELTAADGTDGNGFGRSISLSADGNMVAVGAFNADGGRGAAYVYRWDGTAWNEDKLTASDGSAGDLFGADVAVAFGGNSVIVGSTGDDGNKGAVYLFNWTGTEWDEFVKLTADVRTEGDIFGAAVANSQDGYTAVAGATSPYGGHPGYAQVYRWDGTRWNTYHLTASNGMEKDYFGSAVSISADGSTILIGASGAETDGVKAGAVYVFQWNGNGWDQIDRLTASDGAADSFFGSSVAISQDGGHIASGALFQGSAYHFENTQSGWQETQVYSGNPASVKYGSGVAVSKDGGAFVVGAPGDETLAGYMEVMFR